MGALATAVQQGKALYAGISNYSPQQARAAHAALAEHGPSTAGQIEAYVGEERPGKKGPWWDRHVEHEELFPVLEDLGMGCIVFSPLAQGLLTDRYLSGIPADSRAAKGRWMSAKNIDATYLERARALNEIAQQRGQSLAQLALTWVLRQPRVTSALVGASSVAQLDNNLDALTGSPLR